MAQIKLDHTITDIRGRLGGVYFSRDKSGLHIRAMPRNIRKISYTEPYIRPNSPKGSRAAYIKSWTNVASTYAAIGGSFVIGTWIAHSVAETMCLKDGSYILASSWLWFTHYNVKRDVRGLPCYRRCPRSDNDMPTYVMAGDAWMPDNVNMYIFTKGEAFGDVYRNDTTDYDDRQLYLFFNIDKWYICERLGWPVHIRHWYRHDLDPVGIYSPNVPGMGAMFIYP